MRHKFKFLETDIDGVMVVQRNPFSDPRGKFDNIFNELKNKYIWQDRVVKQVNLSTTEKMGAIRGLHIQTSIFQEAKLITCLSGEIYDVSVDLRRGSSTFGKWFGIKLSSNNNKSIFLPEGIAHGFQNILSSSQVLYCHSNHYSIEHQAGINPLDKTLNINWPIDCSLLSVKDRNLPSFDEFVRMKNEM